jgi:membrane-bound metal-dependent hydrolase YbcI (DUF457 family)
MPSTVVHVGFALLLAAALLGSAYDRRALLVVAGVVVFADLDVFTSLVVEGSHRAMFHTLLVPLFVGTYLYADTRWREASLVRARVGDHGVRVAWVAIAAFCLSAVGLDLFTAAGLNPFYPLFDQFYAFNGQVTWHSKTGLSQTFVELKQESAGTSGGGGGSGGGTTVDVGQKGSSREYRVASGVDPTRGRESANVERVFPVVYNGWQTFLTLAGVVVTAVKLRGLPAWTEAPTTLTEGEVPSTEAPETGDVEASDD